MALGADGQLAKRVDLSKRLNVEKALSDLQKLDQQMERLNARARQTPGDFSAEQAAVEAARQRLTNATLSPRRVNFGTEINALTDAQARYQASIAGTSKLQAEELRVAKERAALEVKVAAEAGELGSARVAAEEKVAAARQALLEAGAADRRQLIQILDLENTRLRLIRSEEAEQKRNQPPKPTGLARVLNSDYIGAAVGRTAIYGLTAGIGYGALNASEQELGDIVAFEDKLKTLQAISGATDQQLTQLAGTIVNVGKTSRYSLSDLADATTTLAQAVRPRTSEFFRSLAPEVIARGRYARLAGAAEYHRGDLQTAERHLRSAIKAAPEDLRAHLLLDSTLRRANKDAEADKLAVALDETKLDGSPEDLMRLAHLLRRSGETDRALKLGYTVAAVHRDNEDVMAAYPGLIMIDDTLPAEVGCASGIQEDVWFDLEGLDSIRDAAGVIDPKPLPGLQSFAPDHALAAKLIGLKAGDEVTIPAEFGDDRRYRVRELKHKYIWLLHDIMATHAARFPEARSMFEMSIKDDDVQPVLDMVREFQENDDILVRTYVDFPVPAAAVAAMARKLVFWLTDHLVNKGINLRTCVGAHDERAEAAGFVRNAKGKGAVLDTLTVWQLRELGHLRAAKSYFGRLCIPRSTFDDLLEMKAKLGLNRGREYMTMGFDGDQAWRQIHTPEDTEKRIAALDDIIAEIQDCCEILPVKGSEDPRMHKMLGGFAVQQVFDPAHLARDEGLIILSEELNLRQFAAQQGVIGGAWLQVTLHQLAADGAIEVSDYLVAVGTLGAMLHEHLWLDAPTLLGILTLEDERAFALFECAIRYMGGRKADMRSHLGVTLDTMRAIWQTPIADHRRGRAIGMLLEQLVASRPDDWKAVLNVLDGTLLEQARRRDYASIRALDYLRGWIAGHFYSLDDIRSAAQVLAAPSTRRVKPSPKPAKKRKQRKR